MAAASLTLRYQGNSGRVYCFNGYASDAAAVLIKFDQGKIAVAGSPDKITAPENGAIVDLCFTSDLATPTHVLIQRQGKPTGDILDVTAQLASVVTRPNPRTPYAVGEEISVMQIS